MFQALSRRNRNKYNNLEGLITLITSCIQHKNVIKIVLSNSLVDKGNSISDLKRNVRTIKKKRIKYIKS